MDNINNPLQAEFELGATEHFDCSFELFASGTVWGSIDGNIENQTDLYEILSTQSGQITSNHNEITSLSETLQSYGDIVTYDASDFATAAQGLLADTALQPNDNISELNNNVGYITSADLPEVNDGTLTIQVNNTDVGTFSANQSTNETINISVPDSATWGNITGDIADQTDLQDALDAKYDASNPDGFITGIDSSDVTNALGYTPYDASNPNGYITNSALTNYVTTNTGQTISAQKNWSGKLNILNGNQITGGVDGNTTYALLQRTNATREVILSNGDDKLRLRGSETRPQYNGNNLALYSDLPTLSDLVTQTQLDAINSGANTTNIGQIATNTNAISDEVTNRQNADNNLQSQIDAITAASDVTDIVGTYAELQAYDSTGLAPNSIIKVLQDENQNDETTYYRWVITNNVGSWVLIGEEGPYYTKSEADGRFVSQTRTVNGKALSNNITLDATDVGALPSSTVIPTVNDGTLDIQVNGSSVGTFTANQSSNTTANIAVPTDTSDLTNGAGFITSSALTGYATESFVTNQGYITGIDGQDVITALGYTPYSSTNPNNYTTETYVNAELAVKQDELSAGTDLEIVTGSADTTVVSGTNSLTLTDANVNSLNYVKLYGACSQTGTPTISNPVDIKCNNGIIKFGYNGDDLTNTIRYTRYQRYINTSGVWTNAGDSSYSIVFPIIPSHKYKIYWDITNEIYVGSIFRWGFKEDTNAGQLTDWVRSTPQSTQTTTVTAPAGCNYLIIQVTGTGVESLLTHLHIETQKIYVDGIIETVKDTLNNTATAQNLYAIDTYIDEQEVLTGAVIRKIGIAVLDGLEEWTDQFSSNNRVNVKIDDIVYLTGRNTEILSTHLTGGGSGVANTCFYSANRVYIYPPSTITTYADWIQFVKDQYAAGTPIILIYPLDTQTTETVTTQTLTTVSGSNTIEITQAELSNLSLEASYDKMGGTIINFTNTSGYQLTSNLVTSVSSASTDSQYPSAKLFYDTYEGIGTLVSTALQPGDDITELNNNAGYITGINSSDIATALGYTPSDINLSNLSDNGDIYIADMASPSNTFKPLTVAASGATYSATSDGYFAIRLSPTADGQYARGILQDANDNYICEQTITYAKSGRGSGFTLPCSKGQKMRLDYNTTITSIYLVYAKGSESEAS